MLRTPGQPNGITLYKLNVSSMAKFNREDFYQRETHCRGAAWRNGIVPCANNAKLTLHNARLVRNPGGDLALQPACIKCMRIVKTLAAWVRHSKIREDGVLLCTETLACKGERLPGLYSCAQHTLNRRSRHSQSERWHARQENSNRLNFFKSLLANCHQNGLALEQHSLDME
ncbi:hypothetical protein B0J14DRAFT_127497 [Halenospora varia]|nr:hypothetical protein B0J14DRAFT_127497 [Halenospora varia]